MSANNPSAGNGVGASKPASSDRRRGTWKWLVAALAVGVAVGAGLALFHRSPHATSATSPPPSTRPDATWPAHTLRAPDFGLVDQSGAPISLRLFRGRPVILTFIDPLCRKLCPFETRVLNQVVSSTAQARRPAVIAVSVNPWGDSRANFRADGRQWHLVPEWRWAVGRYAQLAVVWKRYKIGVQVSKRVFAGITVHEIAHTEASYIIDPAGYERALFLYPFRADDVVRTVQQVAGARS